MCSCNRNEPRRTRPTANTTAIITRNTQVITSGVTPNPPQQPVNPIIPSMDPDRLRIEQLRREAIRRSFGTR